MKNLKLISFLMLVVFTSIIASCDSGRQRVQVGEDFSFSKELETHYYLKIEEKGLEQKLIRIENNEEIVEEICDQLVEWNNSSEDQKNFIANFLKDEFKKLQHPELVEAFKETLEEYPRVDFNKRSREIYWPLASASVAADELREEFKESNQ